MPKPLKLTVIAVGALLFLAAVLLGTLFALISSESGTRFVTGQAGRWTGDLVSWQSLDGTLAGPLEIRGLRLTQPGLELTLDRLALDWQLRALLQRELRITRLQASNGRLLLTDSGETPSTEPFNPANLSSPVDLTLQAVQLRQLDIQQDDQPGQRIDALDLQATLRGDQLEISQLQLRLPQGGVSATGSTALRAQMPLALQASWDGLLPGNAAAASAQARDIPVSGDLGLDGTVNWGEAIRFDLRYRIRADGLEALVTELPATLTLQGIAQGAQQADEVRLQQLTLSLVDPPVSLALQGTLTDISTTNPGFDIALQWQGLRWPLIEVEPTISSDQGELTLAGSTTGYDLALSADLGGATLPAGQWQLRGRGDLQQLDLQQLTAGVLGGELRARGPVSWDPMPRWQLQVEGENLDPAGLVPDVPGQLALALASSGQLDPDTGLAASVDLQRLSGTLLDYALELEASARLAGDTVTLDALKLLSDGNQINANGTLTPEALDLDWTLDASNPGALVPGARGKLTATGRATGSQQAPRILASITGSRLQLNELALAALDADIEAGLDSQDKLAIELVLGPVLSGDQTLAAGARLQVTGSNSQHSLKLALDTASEHLQAELDGGLDLEAASWSGQLSSLALQTDSYGNWRLQEPGTLSLAADAAALGNSCLASEDSTARICLRADRDAVGQSQLSAEIDALPVAMLVADITGDLGGQLRASLAADNSLSADAMLHMTPGDVRVPANEGIKALPHGGGDLKLSVDQKGLVAALAFAAPEDGTIQARVELPQLTSLPPAEQQPLAGRVQASLPRLDSLAAWVPDLAATGGRLNADLQLAGTLSQPELLGELVLTEGRADVPAAGLQLRQIELKAASSVERPGILDIAGSLTSGKGQLTVTGDADISGRAVNLKLQGDRLQVYNTADARASLSPDLQLGWSDDILRLRGTLTIPEAEITPQLQLSSAAAAEDPGAAQAPGQVLSPSPDVVIINAGEEERVDEPAAAAPFRIDSKVKVELGKKVKVNALGFASRLSGAITFSNKPDQVELIPIAEGRLDIEDGTFRSFGQDLDIETGQLIFAAVPATEPELNVRAVRWIDNDPVVTAAGVLVTGSVTQPEIEMFSRPQLETSQIQSYLLTGLGTGDTSNVLSIGTYLTPKLYVGYGYNLLEGTNEFNTLFSITPRYGVGANVGEADTNVNVTISYEH